MLNDNLPRQPCYLDYSLTAPLVASQDGTNDFLKDVMLTPTTPVFYAAPRPAPGKRNSMHTWWLINCTDRSVRYFLRGLSKFTDTFLQFRGSHYSLNCCVKVKANHVAKRTICLLERYHVPHNFFLSALKSKTITAYDQKTWQLLQYRGKVVFPATHKTTWVTPRTSFLKPFSVCLEIAFGSIHNA